MSSDAGSYNPPSGVDDSELVITQELINEFFRWCVDTLGNDEKTCRDRANYLRKPLDPKNDHSVKAYRLLYKFLGKEPPNHLKVPRTGVDLKVPNDEDIVKSISKAASYSQDFGLIYRLLVESGARLTEVLEVLKGYNPENDVRHNGFYTYILGREKGTKKAFYLFHTTPITSKVSMSEDHVSKLCRELGLVRPKYVRKWVATKMLSIGIPSEIVDFIQGRTPRSILTKHYLNLYTLALQHYPKYIETLKQII